MAPELDLGLTPEELDEGAARLGALEAGRLVIGFHPGAAKIPNRWDALHFAEIANRCAEIFDAALVITAGPDDDAPLQEMLSNAAPTITFCCGTSRFATSRRSLPGAMCM